MAVESHLLHQALRTPESQDVTETPIVRAIILADPANAADLVPALARPDTIESRNARRVLCQFGPDAAPHLLTALAGTENTWARTEGIEILWALLTDEDARTVRERVTASAAELSTLLSDVRPMAVDIPELVERDFEGRVCDLLYVVIQELFDDDYDQSAFRNLDDEGRDAELRRWLSREVGGGIA
jgi:hypothetical protein